MEIRIISIGKVSVKWIKDGIEEYSSRLGKYVKFSIKEIPDIKQSGNKPIEKIKELEGISILNELSSSDFFVVMDEKGHEYSSREFAVWIEKIMASGKKRLSLVIGGPFGFSQAVYDRADHKIALSKMTFTHEMAKLICTEQLYRAMSILKGEPYHHD